MDTKTYIYPWVRVLILMLAVVVVFAIALNFTGKFFPTDPKNALIFQNALLLIILGSAIVEHRFTKPTDSMVNSLIGMITLITVKTVAPITLWWIVFSYCLFIFVISGVCVAVSSGKFITGWKNLIAKLTYSPSVILGRANLVFSIVFLFGVFSFYKLQSVQSAILIVFWGVYMSLWPLKIPNLLSEIFSKKKFNKLPIGKLIRRDWPNIVRVSLDPNVNWDHESLKFFKQANGEQFLIIPLYSQFQDEKQLATGLCIPYEQNKIEGISSGFIYETPNDFKLNGNKLAEYLGGNSTSKLVGFIIENSNISSIRFEIWSIDACEEGKIVWCDVGQERVYYQITSGITKEEILESDHHGFQVAIASQLGILCNQGFNRFPWIPRMNTPVFVESEEFGSQINLLKENDYIYGIIPKSKIKIGGPFVESIEHHTAILGITGSGKTELAFDIIRHTVQNDTKVICIDLTSRYEGKLDDLSPVNLSISAELSDELGKKLFEVETGQYGAGNEKKALKGFTKDLRKNIEENVKSFLMSKEPQQEIGLINLEEISNTKATLYITELYLTCLLHFARDNPHKCPRVLIVVEEAHTVMPEPQTMGLGDYESRGLVGKIAQIALQGRKYGVGLLVIAQRTATVSKTVLTQCNTIISFTCFDDTSLKFLKNIFGESHIEVIPNLPFLNAVIFGKALRSERPVIVEIPFDEKKAKKD